MYVDSKIDIQKYGYRQIILILWALWKSPESFHLLITTMPDHNPVNWPFPPFDKATYSNTSQGNIQSIRLFIYIQLMRYTKRCRLSSSAYPSKTDHAENIKSFSFNASQCPFIRKRIPRPVNKFIILITKRLLYRPHQLPALHRHMGSSSLNNRAPGRRIFLEIPTIFNKTSTAPTPLFKHIP